MCIGSDDLNIYFRTYSRLVVTPSSTNAHATIISCIRKVLRCTNSTQIKQIKARTLCEKYNSTIYVLIGHNTCSACVSHLTCPEERKVVKNYSKPIVIEDDVVIGCNVTILGGVTIGKNSVIGAGAVVTQDIPEGVIAYGVPCTVSKEIS